MPIFFWGQFSFPVLEIFWKPLALNYATRIQTGVNIRSLRGLRSCGMHMSQGDFPRYLTVQDVTMHNSNVSTNIFFFPATRGTNLSVLFHYSYYIRFYIIEEYGNMWIPKLMDDFWLFKGRVNSLFQTHSSQNALCRF